MNRIHKFFTFTIYEYTSLPAHRFRNEKQGTVLLEENGRMELNVLQVDHSRPHSLGHRDSMTDDPFLIGCILENLAQATRRQNRLFRNDGPNIPGLGIQDISPSTGNWLVLVDWIKRIVRKRQKVHRNRVGQNGYVFQTHHMLVHVSQNRQTRKIFGENDPTVSVASFAGILKITRFLAVERHIKLIQQERLHRFLSMFDQRVDRLWIRGTIRRGCDIPLELLRI